MAKYVIHQNDANFYEIKHALERVGAMCEGGDWVDLIVGYHGQTFLLEVKTQRGKLSEKQKRFQQDWRGHYAVVRTVQEALKEIGAC